MSNADLQRKFRAAVNGEPNSMIELVKEYLKHPDNPDYVERAYRLLINRSVKVSDENEREYILTQFHWGDYGNKYINFFECDEYLDAHDNHQDNDLQKRINDALSSVEHETYFDTDKGNWLKACSLFNSGKRFVGSQSGGKTPDDYYHDALTYAWKIYGADYRHCAQHLCGIIYQVHLPNDKKAESRYKTAARWGSLAAMYRCAGVQYGCDYYAIHHPNDSDCFKYSLEAAQRGSVECMNQVGYSFKYGAGALKDDRQAFKWLYKAAYMGEFLSNAELAELYICNKLLQPNYAEGYAWLKGRYLKTPDNLLVTVAMRIAHEISDNQSLDFKGKPTKLAETYWECYNRIGCLGPFTSEDLDPYLDYILDAYSREDNLVFDATEDVSRILIELGKHPFETTEAGPSVFISKQRPNQEASNDTSPVSNSTPKKQNDPPRQAYKFESKYKDSFEFDKVSLTLMIGKKLSRSDTLDFTTLIIKYNNTEKDEINVSSYESIKLSPKVRKLLLCLACQSNKKEEPERDKGIKQILINADGHDCTRVNRLLRVMFPNCPIPNRNGSIDKISQKLKIKLVPDYYGKWINCSDCMDCKLSP